MTSGTSYSPPPAFGRFRLLHQIGAGVLGPVFRTHDPDGDRLVAVKAFTVDLTPEHAEQFAAELRGLAAVDMPRQRVAAPVDAGVEESIAYLAQEYVSGESLDSAIRQYGPAPAPDAARLVSHVAEALDAGARVGIFHGTLHPRDILVTPGETHVTGLGIATALEHVGVRAPVRRPYAAPEREAGGEWGAAADIFSLAAIAHEVLTGRRALPGTEEPLPGLQDVTAADAPGLRDVLESALDADPGRRPPTATDFAAALAAALGVASEFPAPSSGRVASLRKRARARIAPKLPGLDEPLAPAESEPLASAAMAVEAEPDAPVPPAGRLDDVTPGRPDAAERPEPPRLAPVEEPPPPVIVRRAGPMEDVLSELPPRAFETAGLDAAGDAKADSEGGADAEAPSRSADLGFDELTFALAQDSGAATEAPAAAEPTADDRFVVDELRPPGMLVTEPPVPRALDLGTSTRPGSPTHRVEPYRPLPSSPPRLAVPVAIGVCAGLLVGALAGYWWGSRAALRPVPVLTPVPAATATKSPVPAAPRGPSLTAVTKSPAAPSTAGPAAAAPALLPSGAAQKPTAEATRPSGAVSRPAASAASAKPAASPAARTTARPKPAAKPSPAAGVLAVETRPAGARVFVDGRDRGVTPLVLRNTAAGSHTVRLVLGGYRPWTTTVTVRKGVRERVAASLERVTSR